MLPNLVYKYVELVTVLLFSSIFYTMMDLQEEVYL